MTVNKDALTAEQFERYRGCYCGLCKSIEKRHGLIGKLALTYDMTFLVLLLSSLYEPPENPGRESCSPLHKKRHIVWQNRFTDYAADMNIILSYYKCIDDWQDERHFIKLGYAKLLESSYRKVKHLYPRQCGCIEQCFTELSEIEKNSYSIPDAAPNCFGRLMGSLFTYYENDHWTDTLENTGASLGKFIYIMDASLDLESDRKHNRYNPLLSYATADEDNGFHELLTMLIGDCTIEFERLPLVQDVDIMRSILYSGVWQKYLIAKRKTVNTGDKK